MARAGRCGLWCAGGESGDGAVWAAGRAEVLSGEVWVLRIKNVKCLPGLFGSPGHGSEADAFEGGLEGGEVPFALVMNQFGRSDGQAADQIFLIFVDAEV